MKQEENFKLFDFFVTLLIKIKQWNKHFCIRTKNVSKDSHQQLSKVKGISDFPYWSNNKFYLCF